ncbi:MAG: AtpZ/AtpI family protein [Actinomycetota bacterium]
MGLSAELVVTTLVGTALGWFVDRGFGTGPLFLILGILLGAVGGITRVWRAWTRRT